MGTGASNQVRSNLDDRNEAACSPPLIPVAHKSIFVTRTEDVGKNHNHSETVAYQSLKTLKSKQTSQKADIRSLPSPSYIKKSSQEETENVPTNLSNHKLHQKVKELELALAVSESQKLDLQDQLQALEQTINATTEQNLPESTSSANNLHETLNAKDQHIKKLEENFNNAQTEFQKKALRFKKRIRGLTKQIFELRQEALITQMELKTKLTQQNDPTEKHELNTSASSEDKKVSLMGPLPSTSHTKIIVELSSQISEQEEQIARLKAEAVEKDQRIEKLESALKEIRKANSIAPASLGSEIVSSNALTAPNKAYSCKADKHEKTFNSSVQLPSCDRNRNDTSTYTKANNNSLQGARHKPFFESSATALSDSDSDWDEGPSLSQIQRHSAPPHSRENSHLSKPYT